MQVGIAGLVQALLYHMGQQDGVLRHKDGHLVALALAHLLDLADLDGGRGGYLRHDALKVQDSHQIVAALGDARGHAIVAAVDGIVRLLDVLPGDGGNAHHRMYAEGHRHLVKACEYEQVVGLGLIVVHPQVLGEVDDGDHLFPGLEDPLHRLMGVRHELYRRRDHYLLHLRHVYAVENPVDGELHDLHLIGAGLQQYVVVHYNGHNP